VKEQLVYCGVDIAKSHLDAGAMRTFNLMKQLPILAKLAPASGGSGNMIEEESGVSLGAKTKPKQERNSSDAIRWNRLSQALQRAVCDR
jgi:hypothetical protein